MKKIYFFVFILIVFGRAMPEDADSIRQLSKPAKLYFKEWIPESRTLSGGLKKSDLKNQPHAEAIVAPSGAVRRVVLKDVVGKAYLTYDLQWNKAKSWSRYRITAGTDTSLTILNDLLFAHDLSDLRPGYRVVVADRRNGDIEKLEVYDDIGSFLYFYTIDYAGGNSTSEKVTSRYFKYDSTLVGYHELEYDKAGRLRGIDYYTVEQTLKYSLGYQYNARSREVSRSIIDAAGILLEKRIMPMNDKYLRKPRRGKSGVSLSEAISFLENASEEDIDALALILEQRYRKEISRTDTTYSPIINVTDTVIIEKEAPAPIQELPSQNIRTRVFRYSIDLGGTAASGSYFSEGSPLSFGLNINTNSTFKLLFLPHLKPTLSGTLLMYETSVYPGLRTGIIIPGHLPLRIPFELSGELGWSDAGPELTGGLMLLRVRKIILGIKTEATIYPDAFKSGSLSGLVNAKLMIGF